MSPKKPNTSWLAWLLKVAVVTTAVSIVSFGAAWGSYKLWSFFSPPSAPPQKPPGTYTTIDSPEETTKEAASDQDCASLGTGSERTNRLDRTPETELKTLTASESDWDSVSLLSEPTVGSQDTTSLVAISDFTPSSGSGSGSGTAGQSSESTGQLKGIDEAEDQKQKNGVLRQNINRREDLIRETNFLITKSNAITKQREAEWNLRLNQLRSYGLPEAVIRSEPIFNRLERDQVLVLTREQGSRTKYRAKIRVLRYQNQKDKADIREPSHVDKEATENRNEPLPLDEEETSLTRVLALGPVTRYISTSCSSTRAILPIAIPKEKSPSPKEKSPSASDSETPRIGWGRRS